MKKIIKLLLCNLLISCFVFSANAQTAADSATVTFQVDMSNVTAPFTTPEVNGTFNNWCGSCWPMTDINGDNIWNLSARVKKDTAYQFKFSADGWAIQENLFPGDPCTVTAWGNTNRTLNVSGDTTLPVVCWASCGPCANGPSAYNVTFQVDMSGVSGFTTPEVNGTFNQWCGNCWAMSDANGDNVWDFTTLLAPGSYDYKFSADGWGIQESLDSSLSCVTTVIDSPSVYVNRQVVVVASDIILAVVPWDGCVSVSTPGCMDATANNFNASANTDDGSCMYNVTLTVDLNCSGLTPGYVAATGPSDGWSCGTYALSDANGDGIWAGTFSLPAGSFEYIYCADGWATSEVADLLANNTASGDWSCTPVTDYFSFANRLITVGAITTADTWGSCSACNSGPVLSQIDLPVTWDDATVNYTVTPFGGTTASLTADPINASNIVLMVDRTAGSPTWAGTTLGTPAGFATDIPLTLTNSTMSVIFWSPQAGVPIRLKVEDSSDPTHTCETQQVTTVANGWETLVFNFSNEAPGTQPLSIGLGFGWTFNMASIFCDFGNVPSSSTIYYIDDVTFGGMVSVV